MRRFYLQRNIDVTGISGAGRVAEGVILSDERVVMSWLSDTPSGTLHDNIEAAEYIHGHNGKSVFVYDAECGEFPKLYQLIHSENKSGLSGIGKVAEVAEFSNGWASLTWLIIPYQIEFFSSMKSLIAVHAGPTQLHSTIDMEY